MAGSRVVGPAPWRRGAGSRAGAVPAWPREARAGRRREAPRTETPAEATTLWKIATSSEVDARRAAGALTGSALDEDRFVHCATADQARVVARDGGAVDHRSAERPFCRKMLSGRGRAMRFARPAGRRRAVVG